MLPVISSCPFFCPPLPFFSSSLSPFLHFAVVMVIVELCLLSKTYEVKKEWGCSLKADNLEKQQHLFRLVGRQNYEVRFSPAESRQFHDEMKK